MWYCNVILVCINSKLRGFAMAKTLTSESLRGVWALVPTPWDAKDHLDEQVLRQDVGYLCSAGLTGLYTTASSGEFFAMDDDEFFCLVSAVVDEARSAGVPVQVCCSAPNTRGFLRRAEYAVEAGADAIQVILPYYIQLDLEEAFAFVETAARACGDVPLVHYNTGYAKLTFEAEDYRSLKERVPTLIGTKLPRDEPLWISNVCRLVPDVSHFCGEYAFAANFAGGVRGIYSWLAVTNPRLMVRWYETCAGGDWNEAIRIQQLVNRFKLEVKTRWAGKSDAAVNKADAALNPNIHCALRVREPYRSCTEEDLDRARSWAEHNFPELLEL